MFYNEALSYIKNIERAGSVFGTERMRELLILLGEPDKRLKFVHIAGTNGKGSVCAFLTSIFVAAGLKVGTYNSPSVFSYNERFLIDGVAVSDEAVAKYMSIVRAAIENENAMRAAFGLDVFTQTTTENVDEYENATTTESRSASENGFETTTESRSASATENKFETAIENENAMRAAFGLDSFAPTAFEIETAIAFLCFFENDCDICVLETGLGGRLDATNVIENKELAVITSIGLDHCAMLGNTLADIAAEKAAIIKNRVVTCAQNDEIMAQIENPYNVGNGVKTYRKADVIIAKTPKKLTSELYGQTFEYDGKGYSIKLLGAHQLTNASVAICAAQTLRDRLNIPERAIREGLLNAVWRARFEIVKNANERFNVSNPHDKVCVLDGAHNPQGADALAKCLKDYFAGKRISLVLGVLADKDVDGIAKCLAPIAHKIYTVTPPSPRALDAQKLKTIVYKYVQRSEILADENAQNIVYSNAQNVDSNTQNIADSRAQNMSCNAQNITVIYDVKDAVQTALNDEFDVVVLCGSLTLFSALNIH